MPAAMPCKTPANCRGETCRTIGKHKTKYARVVDADESMRIRLEGVPQRYHEDHISAKGINFSLSHCNLVHEFIPMPQAWQQWKKNWKNLRNRNKKDLIEEARRKGRKVHFASLMDLCHLNNSELEPQFQTYKGRIELRGDIVKDDSGSYAVFTQGSSASQMTAAKVMDTVSRLPGCDGQTADAVSAYTEVKMEDAHKLLRIPISECPDIWIRPPKHKWPKSWSSMEDPVVPLERNLYGHPLGGPLWERQFEKVLLKFGWEKVPNWECSFVNRENGLGKTISNWLERNRTSIRLGKTLLWEDQHHFSTTFIWVALKESVKSARILWRTAEICSNSGFLLDPRKNYRPELQGNLMQRQYLLGATTWMVMLRNSWKDNAHWRTKQLNSFSKSQRHASMTITFKEEEENGSVGELSTVCSQIVLKCWYLARIGRPDILWSVNKFARSITKWTKACDKRLARLISYIHHTCEYRQYCYVGSTAQHCSLGFFQDSDFAGDLEDSKSTSGGLLCIFGCHTLVPTSWMCKKQTSVSHSSSEAEVISSLDAGLRVDGIPALDLWDLVIEVLHSSPNQTNKTKDVREQRRNLSATLQSNMRKQTPTKHINLDLTILITFHQTEYILVPMICCMSLRKMKPWLIC